jgi:hypothetical protein
MDEILSRFLSATVFEELPYVVGFCGDFREGITQQAGPRLIPGLSSSLNFLCLLIVCLRYFLGIYRQQSSST